MGEPAEGVEVSPGPGPEVVGVSSSADVVEVPSSLEVVEVPPPHKRRKKGQQHSTGG